eukprot:8470120-Heterocapsa_arctica.AAC.1
MSLNGLVIVVSRSLLVHCFRQSRIGDQPESVILHRLAVDGVLESVSTRITAHGDHALEQAFGGRQGPAP